MQTIGAFEAKTHFSALLQQVEKGAQIVITRHGNPIAKLVPITGRDQKKAKEAIQRLEVFASQHSLGKLDWKTLRDTGRR